MEKYEFVVLANPDSPLTDLKFVMCDRKVRVDSESINLYSPYKEIIPAYNLKYPEGKMWGIGFRKEILDIWIEKRQIKSTQRINGNLIGRKLYTSEIDLKDFDVSKGDFFLVVPDKGAMKELCLRNKKEGYKRYEWRCKGLNNVYCKGKTDTELEKYLNKDGRFDFRNIIDIDENELFRNYQLIPPSKVLRIL